MRRSAVTLSKGWARCAHRISSPLAPDGLRSSWSARRRWGRPPNRAPERSAPQLGIPASLVRKSANPQNGGSSPRRRHAARDAARASSSDLKRRRSSGPPGLAHSPGLSSACRPPHCAHTGQRSSLIASSASILGLTASARLAGEREAQRPTPTGHPSGKPHLGRRGASRPAPCSRQSRRAQAR